MYHYAAKITNVVDGDTVDVSIDLGFKIEHHLRVRLNGIDAAEKQWPRGKRTKDILIASLLGRDVKVTTYHPDKYGRYLADVFLADGSSINEQLVTAGVVKAYAGDSRSDLWTMAELLDGTVSVDLR